MRRRCIATAATSCSSAIPPFPRPPKTPTGRPSPSRKRRAPAASACAPRFRSPSSIQSTGRPAEAHAVLGPALEGFAPTTEFPEIAEAQALLGVLSQTEEVRAEATRRQRLTLLQVAYGNALIAARGFGAPETTEAFARARESASGDKNAPGRLAADYGLWVGSYVRGDLPSMRAHAAALLSDIEARPDSPEAGVAHRAAGMNCWHAGEYREARDHLERALALFQPGRDDDLAYRFGLDPGVSAMAYLAVALWPLGEVDRAISLIDRMQTRMADVTHVGTLALGRMHAALFELMRGDPARAAPSALELARLAREHDLNLWRAFGVFLQGWTASGSGAPADGLADMRSGVELLREQNVLYFDGQLKIALAEAEARAGDPDRAVAILDEALATCDRTGYRAFEAELHRARGEMLLERDPADSAPAEHALLTAIAVAKQQGTRSFELRAAFALAKLYRATDRPADAHAVLAPALEGFSPTPELPEIDEAQALMRTLCDDAAVRSALADRSRRLRLHTSFGNALIAARGYQAPETTAAFQRAGELATASADPIERASAYYGLWASNYVRAELGRMNEMVSALLREADRRPDSAQAGVAHRVAGTTRWFEGRFDEARTHFRRAMTLFDPERDRELVYRFGADVGVTLMGYLAFTLAPMGELVEASLRISQMLERAEKLESVATRVWALGEFALIWMSRWNSDAVASVAEPGVRLAIDHGMKMWAGLTGFANAWAQWRICRADLQLTEMRAILAELHAQDIRVYGPLFLTALADAEREIGDARAALHSADTALELASASRQCWFEAETWRVKGAILSDRNRPDTNGAEAAFAWARELAARQGARAYKLSAALALAKLQRAGGRLLEAHNVLAPALEGLSPTPEMPEVAEAQALLERLA